MNVRVDLQETIRDGMEVVFKAPCNYAEVEGLILYYPTDAGTESQVFAFADAHANDLADLDVLFAKDAVVKVILDLSANMAFIQNADTNAYLERRLASLTILTSADGGATLTLTDSAPFPAQELKVNVKAAQDGTGDPSPTNIRPITHQASVQCHALDNNALPVFGVNATLPENSAFGYVDFVLKKYVQTHGVKVITGTENWYTWGTFSNGSRSVKLAISDIYTTPTYTDRLDGCCSHYINSYHGGTYGGYEDLGVSACKDALQLCICDKRFTTVDEYKAYFAEQYANGTPVTVVYKLKTPVEHDIEIVGDEIRTVYPSTIIGHDGESVAISYVADTKNYIDKKFNELATAIVANT